MARVTRVCFCAAIHCSLAGSRGLFPLRLGVLLLSIDNAQLFCPRHKQFTHTYTYTHTHTPFTLTHSSLPLFSPTSVKSARGREKKKKTTRSFHPVRDRVFLLSRSFLLDLSFLLLFSPSHHPVNPFARLPPSPFRPFSDSLVSSLSFLHHGNGTCSSSSPGPGRRRPARPRRRPAPGPGSARYRGLCVRLGPGLLPIRRLHHVQQPGQVGQLQRGDRHGHGNGHLHLEPGQLLRSPGAL